MAAWSVMKSVPRRVSAASFTRERVGGAPRMRRGSISDKREVPNSTVPRAGEDEERNKRTGTGEERRGGEGRKRGRNTVTRRNAFIN